MVVVVVVLVGGQTAEDAGTGGQHRDKSGLRGGALYVSNIHQLCIRSFEGTLNLLNSCSLYFVI